MRKPILVLAAVAGSLAAQPPPSQVKIADARPGDVRLLVSNAIRVPFEAVKAQAESKVGHHFVIQYGASLNLKPTMESGQPFEVAIVTPDVLDDMIAKGKVVAGSRFDVGQSPVAVGLRGDVPGWTFYTPFGTSHSKEADISTPESLKRILLGATAIRWSLNGAAGPTVKKVIDGLGIAEAMKSKPTSAADLKPGEYELFVNPGSELRFDKTFKYLGDIPKEFDVPVVMAAGVGAAGDQKAAKALIDFLRGRTIEPSLKTAGMKR